MFSISNVPVDVITKAEVHRQSRFHLPVILCIETRRLLEEVAMRIPKCAVGIVRFSQQQRFHFILKWIARNGGSVVSEVPNRHPGAGVVTQAVCIRALVIAAELECVISFHPGEVLGPIPRLIRPRGDGIPLHASDVATVP